MRRVNVPLLLLFLGAAASARANDFMFSQATAPVVLPLMLLWSVVGVAGAIVLRHRGVRLDHVGLGAFLCTGFFMLLGAHYEIVATFWMIYLALSTVYYAFPRSGVPPADRRANFAFHGIFLALVIVGGVVGKVVYYSQVGDYSRFLGSVELYPGWLILFGILTLVALVWFCLTTVRSARRRAVEHPMPPSGDELS